MPLLSLGRNKNTQTLKQHKKGAYKNYVHGLLTSGKCWSKKMRQHRKFTTDKRNKNYFVTACL